MSSCRLDLPYCYHRSLKGAYACAARRAVREHRRIKVYARRKFNPKFPHSRFRVSPANPPRRTLP